MNTDDRQAKSNFIIVHIPVCIKLFEDVKEINYYSKKISILEKV